MSSFKDYEEWKDRTPTNPNWVRVGDWLYPDKENPQFSQVVYHTCKEMYDAHNDGDDTRNLSLEKCNRCGASVPEGLRMVALLESL